MRLLLPHPYRNEAGALWPVTGETLASHLARLAATRAILLAHVHDRDLEDFRRERRIRDYVVTPEWILYHFLEHEAHHSGQIRLLRQMGESRS